MADKGFEILVRKFFLAGYMIERHQEAPEGILHGRPVSPIFINIVLNELDKYIVEERKKIMAHYKAPRHNLEYTKLIRWGAKDKTTQKTLTNPKQAIKQRIPGVVYDRANNRLWYIRYMGSFIIGIAGAKSFAIEKKEHIAQFLTKKLNLKMVIHKTKITNVATGRVIFLGIQVHKALRRKLPFKSGKFVAPHIMISAPVSCLIESLLLDGIGKKMGNGA